MAKKKKKKGKKKNKKKGKKKRESNGKIALPTELSSKKSKVEETL